MVKQGVGLMVFRYSYLLKKISKRLIVRPKLGVLRKGYGLDVQSSNGVSEHKLYRPSYRIANFNYDNNREKVNHIKKFGIYWATTIGIILNGDKKGKRNKSYSLE